MSAQENPGGGPGFEQQGQPQQAPQPVEPPQHVSAASPGDGGFAGYVVALGASAGGLDALERFFDSSTPDSGVVYVVIQHLSPDHKSMMSNLLARHTAMPVVMVEDDMAIRPDHVYLIPPGAIMHATAGHLHLTPKNPRGLTLPIDIFFTSLAESYGKRAVGVILSGTGTDGTRGVSAINAAGGFVAVQEPDSAKFDGMPRSAIATGVVDAILPAEELPVRVLAHVRDVPYQPAGAQTPLVEVRRTPQTQEESLAAILSLLLQVGGIDFREYKPATILRRIERRMQVRHAASLADYLDLLEEDRSEALTLRREMLIAVTAFFRDAEAWDMLATEVIPAIMEGKNTGDPIRVWSAGSASGEEAYSLGMLFLEAFERERKWPVLKIFATDVDQTCVESAALAQYPESAAVELTAARLERFFVRTGTNFAIRNELRQCVVVARHNLLSDPPFTRMDLVSCRNTLIYFKPVAQERALRCLQYAIRPEGYLFLGSSESLSGADEGMRVLSARNKIFCKVGPTSPLVFDRAQTTSGLQAGGVRAGSARRGAGRFAPEVLERATGVLLGAFAPPAVLVTANHEVAHLFGDVAPYLRVRPGLASLELNRLLPDTLVPVASALLYKAQRDQAVIVSDLIHLHTDSLDLFLRLSARPVEASNDERMSLLCFEPQAVSPQQSTQPVDVGAETMERIGILERELVATRENLQATIEELETANEELQATNEELMASNEELQSSNEELQSVNEELNTVNVEYQEKMMILTRINADLDSMAKTAGVATVFVDQDLMLTRYSPDAAVIFRLREADLGRRLDDLAHSLDYQDLISDIETTLRTERMIEREILTLDGRRTFLVRILPYSVPSTPVRGAVATFVDLTAFRDLARLQSVIDALPEHVAVLDPAGTIKLVNHAWVRFAKVNGDPDLRASGVGANYLQACQIGGEDADTAGAAVNGLRAVLEGSAALFSLEYPCHSPTEQRWFVMNVAAVGGPEFGAVVSHVEITAYRRAQRESDLPA